MKALLTIGAAVLLTAGQVSAPADLTVHEWGTFTSVAGPDGSPIEWDALGCNDLPRFVHYFRARDFKTQLRGTVRMETPVLYFYSPAAVDAHVNVLFPKGLITEWYPQAEHHVYQATAPGGPLHPLQPNLSGIDLSLKRVTGGIEWKNVRVRPDAAPQLPREPDASRYYAARATDASPVDVSGQQEKFLFYRGVGTFAPPLSARVDDNGSVAVENLGHDQIPALFLFENREGRQGYRTAGTLRDTATLQPAAIGGPAPPLSQELERTLVSQGLFQREAHAMVETWRDSWFEEGSRLIYVLPARAVDAMLPLAIEPAPSKTVRVFVGRIELITPEMTRSVARAIERNDRAALDRYGRFAGVVLERTASAHPAYAYRIDDLRRSGAGQACGVF